MPYVSHQLHTVHTYVRTYTRTYIYHYVVVWGCITAHHHCPPMPCHPLLPCVHACFRSGNNMPAPRCHLAERCSSWWSLFLGGASWNSSECRAVSLYQYPPVFLCFSLLVHRASSLLPLPSSSVGHHTHMLSYPFNEIP